jgi:putative transposase
LRAEYVASERRVCGLMEVPRTSFRYRSCRDDRDLRERLLHLAREKPRYGYRRLHVLLRRDAVVVNHKKVQRVYRELGLTVKRTRRKRLERELRPRPVLMAPNQEWSIDFASDVTAGGQRLRVLSVIDSFTKQSVALEVDTSFPSRRVTRVLSRAMNNYGKPLAMRCDNGPEISSRHFLAWAIEEKIDIVHIRPGKPTENAYVESFHGRLRDECLNVSWFWNLFDARRKISAWQREYNTQRPHSSLGYLTPEEFARQWQLASPSYSLDRAEGHVGQGNPAGSLRSALTHMPLCSQTILHKDEARKEITL